MKHNSFHSVRKGVRILPLYFLFLCTFLLTSCGSRSGYFKIEGRFLHINQGELYVYSPDGGLKGIDTIKIQAGRFAYETPMPRQAMLMLVFPNFSEHPVFATPGGSVDIKADASHLKEMTVEGTKENELMTKFRKMTVSVSPPEERRLAEQFVKDHPESPVGIYLVRKYFIQTAEPDYRKALELVDMMHGKQTENGLLVQLKQSLAGMLKLTKGSSLPRYKATDTEGRQQTDADLRAGIAVINVWATWNYESQETQRIIRDKRKNGGSLKALSINIDASPKECQRWMESNEISWPNVCDGQMLESPLLKQLGLSRVPETVVLRNGRVIERNLSNNDLRRRLNELLP